MKVKKGDKVQVDYTGTLTDGTVFDTTEKRGPLEFEVGSGKLIKGFDSAVIGMEVGKEKDITLKPDEAYGEKNPKLVQEITKDQLPQEAKKGSTLIVTMPSGHQVPATIKDINKDKATLDLNHPLAGKTLKFKIKILKKL